MGKNHSTKQLNENADNYFTSEKVYETIEAQNKLSVNSDTAFVEADAFIGNPYSLLGRVMMIRKSDGKCPEKVTDKGFMTALAPLPIPGIEIDEKSKIQQPIKRGSIIVTKDLSVKVGFLNYLSGELTAKDTFSIMVIDQSTGLIDVQAQSWQKGLQDWLINPQNVYFLQDPDVCYLYVIVGFVQKNVIRKKYTKLDAKAGGGAYGIFIDGEIHTSNEEYYLDIRFGITPVILKSPTYTYHYPQKDAVNKMALIKELTESTKSLVEYSIKNERSIKYSLPNEIEMSVFSKIKSLK